MSTISKHATAVAIAALTLWVANAHAATGLPRYDAMAFCQQVSDTAGGSDSLKKACVQQEQSSYNALKLEWDSVAERTRHFCDDVGRSTGGSYQMLSACIANETAASKSTPSFKY